MIVHNRVPLSIAEVKALVKNVEEKPAMHDYLKTFAKLSKADSEKLSAEITSLNSMKIKTEDIVKLADFLPRDIEELNKVFNHVQLTEEEGNAILSIINKY